MNNETDFGVVDIPEDGTVIWRYMSFDRFKQLIESSELYFSRVDHFSDFTEGVMAEKTFKSSVRDMISQGNTEADAIGISMALVYANAFMHQKYFFANCWAGINCQSNLL